MSRLLAKKLLWAFWLVNLATVVGFWASASGAQLLAGDLNPLIAFGRLAGLLATFCALVQFVLMGRAGWLEPIFGMDRIAQAHRLNGYVTYLLALGHPLLLVAGFAPLTGLGVVDQYFNLIQMPYVPLAAFALLILTITVGLSIYIARKHLTFESWYYVHLLNYVFIALIPFHQLTNGGDFLANPAFHYYWLGLYSFAALTIIVWRFGRPVYRFFRFKFRVEKVVPEAQRATSIYITGRNLQQFRATGGQFVLVRFLRKGMWWQEHPFSLSRMPAKEHLRLTIRQLGDFTNEVPHIEPGTQVVISGPHGAFGHAQAVMQKTLYIAGGIGITPIRAMMEESVGKPVDAVFLYGNRAENEIVLREELDKLGAQLNMPIYHVLSDDPRWAGEKGFIDQEKISRLVPDVAERDIFLCGPPPMMAGVIKALEALGVPTKQIHYERFELHAKPLKT